MKETNYSLKMIFEGWDGYQQSIVNAVAPLNREQLVWQPSPEHRSVGDLVRHIALGRLSWFMRMDAPGSKRLVEKIAVWRTDNDGNRYIVEDGIDIAEQADTLVSWLESSWEMIDQTLSAWTVVDLSKTYRHVYYGQAYAVSRQWTVFRILAHDIHHGGELSLMLGLQGIEAPELSALGGHIISPPLAES